MATLISCGGKVLCAFTCFRTAVSEARGNVFAAHVSFEGARPFSLGEPLVIDEQGKQINVVVSRTVCTVTDGIYTGEVFGTILP